MALGGTYNSGLIGVTQGSTTVTGHGVLWSAAEEVDTLQVGVAIAKINTIGGTYDSAELKDPWSGPTVPMGTATITIASPGVVTWPSTAPPDGTPVKLATTGALPTGFVAGTVYYCKSPSGSASNLSATPGGAAINTSGSQSGVHKIGAAYRIFYDSVARFDPALTQQKVRDFINLIEIAAIFGVPLQWDVGTADADPGSGLIRANNASLGSATTLYISKTSRAGSSISAHLASLDDSTNPSTKGKLILGVQPHGTQATFEVGAVTDATGYVKLAISGHSGETSFVSGDLINFQFVRAGDGFTGREVLASARIYYVHADGSDSNNGLANTAGGAFLTIQHAIDVAALGLDNHGYDVTIHVAAGTYPESPVPRDVVGGGRIFIVGDGATPSDVVIGGDAFAGTPIANTNYPFFGKYVFANLRLSSNSASALGTVNGAGGQISLGDTTLGLVEINQLGSSAGVTIRGINGGRFDIIKVKLLSISSSVSFQGVFDAAGKGDIFLGANANAISFPSAIGSGKYLFVAKEKGFILIQTATTFENTSNWQGTTGNLRSGSHFQSNVEAASLPGGGTFTTDFTCTVNVSDSTPYIGNGFQNAFGKVLSLNNTMTLAAGADGKTFTFPAADCSIAPLNNPVFTGSVTLPGDPASALQAATKQYVDAIMAASDAMVFKGVIDCSANPNYPTADRGWTYRVSVVGKIGGASGINVEAGDLLVCLTDGTASGNQATVGSAWSIAQANLDGAVIGPASVTDGNPAVFDGTTGKLLKQLTFAAFKSALSLSKSDVGLGSVDNTSDADKPVSTAQATADALALHKATAGEVSALTQKSVLVSGDHLLVEDSAASNAKKRATFANLIASFASIGQLPFPSTQSASNDPNTLDDYVEADWPTAPAITFATPGDLSVAYSSQTGKYTKIGRILIVKFLVVTSSFTFTTASGALRISNLPYNFGDTYQGTLIYSGITKTNYTSFVPQCASGNPWITVNACGSGVANASVTATDVPSGGTIALSGTLVGFV